MTEPEPGFVPLYERLGEVMAWLRAGRAMSMRDALPATLAYIDDHLATLTEAIETLQDVEGRQ